VHGLDLLLQGLGDQPVLLDHPEAIEI
jgi:hypothetical protein